MLKMNPNYPTSFHMDGRLSIPLGIRSSYTGMKFEIPPIPMFASSGAVDQPLSATAHIAICTAALDASAGVAAQPPPPAAALVGQAQAMTQKEEKGKEGVREKEKEKYSTIKPRPVFTGKQLFELERAFGEKKYLNPDEMFQLANTTNLSYQQVKVWLQNKRTKWTRAPTVTKEVVALEREKLRSRGQLRKTESIIGPIMMNKIVTAAGLQYTEMEDGQLHPLIILEERN